MEPREDSLYQAPPKRPHQDLEWLERYSCVQSMQFMIDCLPMIDHLVTTLPHAVPVRVLDVGTGSGAGAQLLATRHVSSFLGARMIVDAIELDGAYLERYVKARFKNINYLVGDVMELKPDVPWDVVTCSHTIEHIEDYMPFIHHLQSLARKWVLFYAPWEEELGETPGHVNSIDKRFLEEVKAVKHQIVNSPAWGRPAFKDYQCVVFVLPGTADPPKIVAPKPKPPLTVQPPLTLGRVARGVVRRLRHACSVLVPRQYVSPQAGENAENPGNHGPSVLGKGGFPSIISGPAGEENVDPLQLAQGPATNGMVWEEMRKAQAPPKGDCAPGQELASVESISDCLRRARQSECQ